MISMNSEVLFTDDDLRKLSDYKSFERGEDYYNNDYVRKITKAGNRFEGTVSGSRNYTVTLIIDDEVLNFSCSCPYGNGGICKHSVAFGFAIINNEYTDLTANEKLPNTSQLKIDFEKSYKDADSQKKLDFLKQLLAKDRDLQNQFVSFVESPKGNLDSIAGIDIEKIKNDVFKKLTAIDFNSAVENFNNSYDDYYNDDAPYEAAYLLITDVFDTYFSKATEYIKRGNLIDTFRIVFGVYEGMQCLPEPIDDEYCIFDDGFNERVSDLFSETLNTFAVHVESVVHSNQSIMATLDLFFERFNTYESTVKTDESAIRYDLKIFKSILLSFITNSDTASYLHKKIQDFDLENLSTSYVLLKIAEHTANEALWFETAETFAEFEEPITQQLLEKYKQRSSEGDFNRIAKLAFGRWPQSFDQYLIQNMNAENELYIKAFKHYVKEKYNIPFYKKLRELLGENELNQFIREISTGYKPEFYIQILEIEKRYEEILQFVQKNKDYYSFENIVRPIVSVYPDECFEIIVDKCRKALAGQKRDRGTYQNIAAWLKTIKGSGLKQTEIKAYVQTLYSFKPNLPALKDELKKAELVV